MKYNNEGYTMMHEHITINLSYIKNDNDANLNCMDATIAEFKKLYKYGVRNIVDVTNIGMGRNIDYMKEVELKSGINIISCTGFYKDPFFPDKFKESTIGEVCDIMVNEITSSIEGSDRKAILIGEIGTSKDKITPNEKKLFQAAAKAHKITGAPITTHTTLGSLGHKQIDIFEKYGVDLSKVIIGHVDLSKNIEYIISLLKRGVYVQFDTIGKNNYFLDENRVKQLKILEERGFMDKVLLSVDITRKSHLKKFGGLGYAHLFETFIPMLLKSGVSSESIDKMLRHNPNKILQ